MVGARRFALSEEEQARAKELSLRQIAAGLGRSHTTLRREVARNRAVVEQKLALR